ncbi:YeiH family protein [Desulfurobacterium thermolithotrophum]|uniref:YeiH family protein n=1 Tax=Desulfurobacterium thermolithotrophum TaxID=64160 RepID=UPI0013CF45F4|nr:YeiH family protein [Desulfurobacterium thermolithotrophum]
MAFSKENRAHTLNGILFVALFAIAATYISQCPFFSHLGISPLIIGIVLGMFYANTLRNKLPEAWTPGIIFSTKTLLRAAIVFYGFRITFQSIAAVGVPGIVASVSIVFSTFFIGYLLGTKIFKLDRDTSILTSAGSSICGAAAVLATEPVVKAEAHKSAIAVSTVVLFGTIAMFLYPFLYKAGYVHFDPETMGVYIGATVHEVAHVVAAGNAIGPEVAKDAIIVKMIRVMLIAPFLIILSLLLPKLGKALASNEKTKITIPWFAIGFIAVAGFNSLHLLPEKVVSYINALDTFALTMAMTALGMETSMDKFKGVGLKPIYLAFVLFLWLIFGGYFITKFAMSFGA